MGTIRIFVRQALAALLAVALPLCVLANPEVIGTAAACRATTLRGSELEPGSTLFSGDLIATRADGGALIALGTSGRIELGGETQVRLSRQAAKVRMEIGKGRVGFLADSSLELRLADATIRAAGAEPTLARIVAVPGQKGIIAVERGELLIATASSKKTLTLHGGESVEIAMEPAPAPQVGSAASASTLSGRWLLVVGLVAAGTVVAVAVWLNRGEPKLTNIDKRTEISPFRFP